ncbi:hypothetical protein CYANOKiyG1_15780 [Okeania sp. KiyG1]|nr:hypothetical protein CYANOKiyG1_15780 [Okeania sp. KiyG1]
MGRWGDGEMGDGEMGGWGDGEMGGWGDGEMGGWGDGRMGGWGMEKYLVIVEDETFLRAELNGFDITPPGRGSVGSVGGGVRG